MVVRQTAQTHVTGLEDLQAKLGMMLKVAQSQLERHPAAKETLDATDKAIGGGFLKQLNGMDQE